MRARAKNPHSATLNRYLVASVVRQACRIWVLWQKAGKRNGKSGERKSLNWNRNYRQPVLAVPSERIQQLVDHLNASLDEIV